jgi:hypothetical protein
MSGSNSNRGVLIGVALVVLAAGIGAAVYFYQMPPAATPPAEPPPAASLPAPAPVPAASPVPAAPVPVTELCVVPGPAPAMPRATVATAEDMKTQHDAVQAFVRALEAYQACVNALIDHPPAGTDEATKQVLITLSNHAIDRANALADAFAEQERIFKTHQPETPAK